MLVAVFILVYLKDKKQDHFPPCSCQIHEVNVFMKPFDLLNLFLFIYALHIYWVSDM